jgi:hypothetical protein
MQPRSLLLLIVVGLCTIGCGVSQPDEFGFGTRPNVDPVDPDDFCVTEGAHRCRLADYEVCRDGVWALERSCDSPTPLCSDQLGCTACNPDRSYCVGEDVYTCSSDGLDLPFVEECESTEACLAGQCRDACDVAVAQRSYLGCSFLAVATTNLVHEVFNEDFAIVIGNPHPTAEAQVVVARDGTNLRSLRIPPRSTAAISLPIVPELKTGTNSVIARRGAFEVESNLPVAAYQFNPLNFRLDTPDGPVASFTNDASLLLPLHALTGLYRINTHPSFGVRALDSEWEWLPGFVAVAATEDATRVVFSSKAFTVPGGVPAIGPGGTTEVILDRGDVLQLLSRLHEPTLDADLCAEIGGREGVAEEGTQFERQTCFDDVGGDFTGSVVTASAEVAVWAGHMCTFMPVDSFACDHLEEMMLPRETLGDLLVMTAPKHPSRSGTAPAVYRVMSAVDDNYIEYTTGAAVDGVLDAGEFTEFTTDGDFVVIAQGPVHVTQTMVGQRELTSTAGDPAMGTGVALSQWRAEYDFLAPETYTTNHVNVAARDGSVVYLDGILVDDWESIAGADYSVARVRLEPGPHHIESLEAAPFGITSYGYADYTSYLTPGGMNFVR